MVHEPETPVSGNGHGSDLERARNAFASTAAGSQAYRRGFGPATSGDTGGVETACPGSFAAAIVDLLPILPMIACVATVFAYVGGPTLDAQSPGSTPLAAGFLVTVVVGVSAMLLAYHLSTSAERVHPQSYAELRHRADRLAARLRVLRAVGAEGVSASEAMAIEEARAHCKALVHGLSRGGTQWVLGTGYLELLARVHRAEEALFLVEPVEEVLAGALYDELRVQGSAITDCRRLVTRLRTAVQLLSPSAALHLNDQPPARPTPAASAESDRATPPTADGSAAPVAELRSAPAPAPAPVPAAVPGSPGLVAEARATLREIRRLVNEFRDERREALVRSRCRLLGTTTVTGLITYVLLAFTVTLDGAAVDAPGKSPAYISIVAATAIYLVGATVGLFNRLYVESGDDAAGEDYGLSRTRLVLTPILSGLAAVGGVLITAMMMTVIDGTAMSPAVSRPAPKQQIAASPIAGAPPLAPALGALPLTPTPAPTQAARSESQAGGESGADPRSLLKPALTPAGVFNLEGHPFAIVLAAIFGLTPGLFLDRLKRASEQPKLDLKSTEAHRLENVAPPG